MALASVLASGLSSLSAPLTRLPVDSADQCASSASQDTSGTATSTPTLSTVSSLSNSTSSLDSARMSLTRRNEHLAVLLPKRLWKPDSQASRCDVFFCRKQFSIWERRHHCRKCGGVFCGDCSARMTPLLDASNLGFIHPPRNVPITVFESATSPIVESRVCDECWDQLHGSKTPRSPVTSPLPISVVRDTRSSASSVSSSVSTPLDGCPLSTRPLIRRIHTSPRPPPLPYARAPPHSLRTLTPACTLPTKNGGGRWEPKPITTWVGHRVPGCKAPYELELEREEEENRIRRANPVIVNGDFQLRAPRELEPHSIGGPFQFSTF
ncbi:Early endosome antigen 1 [Grifola frondosa]|uniref:Early endosome antigen 1 n=1 Tax=Grifola frondosa TaxID=5627 RepID=A0A1C7MSV6_GRIFR|nr:Early endosome antigen 1 [Grifola frondosa]